MLDAGSLMLDTGSWMLDTGAWIVVARSKTLDTGYQGLKAIKQSLSLAQVLLFDALNEPVEFSAQNLKTIV